MGGQHSDDTDHQPRGGRHHDEQTLAAARDIAVMWLAEVDQRRNAGGGRQRARVSPWPLSTLGVQTAASSQLPAVEMASG